jgi:hypothetical protein
MDVGGTEADVTYKMDSKVVDVADKVQVEHGLRDLVISVGGETMEAPFGPLTMTQTLSGVIHKAEGGVAGTDPYRMAVVTHFFAPKDELEKDGTWKEVVEPIAGSDLKKLTIEGTYLGPDVDFDKAAQKFKLKVTEGDTGFLCESTFWITLDGKLLKQDGTFEKLPVPVAGTDANGKVKLEKI